MTVDDAIRHDKDLTRHVPLLWHIANQIAATLEVDADEVISDVCIAAERLLREYNPTRSSVATYLCKYCGHRAIYLYRRDHEHHREAATDPTVLTEVVVVTGEDETPRIPQHWFDVLDDAEYEVLRQRLEGATTAQLAAGTGRAGDGGRQAAALAFKKLRTAVNGGVDPCPNPRLKRSAMQSTPSSSPPLLAA